MRKQTRRRVTIPLPPRGLRPRLDSDQVRDLGLCHMHTLDDISKGTGSEETLWNLVGATLTWSRVADLLCIGQDEMKTQLELVTHVVERYHRTGRVGFTGTEYQTAKLGIDVMDQLAELVDQPTAMAAAAWSEGRLNGMAGVAS